MLPAKTASEVEGSVKGSENGLFTPSMRGKNI